MAVGVARGAAIGLPEFKSAGLNSRKDEDDDDNKDDEEEGDEEEGDEEEGDEEEGDADDDGDEEEKQGGEVTISFVCTIMFVSKAEEEGGTEGRFVVAMVREREREKVCVCVWNA